MNNWTIGKKLITSFLAGAAITLLLGLVGFYGAVKSDEAITDIGTNRLPSVQSLLVIGENGQRIKAAQRTLMNPNLNQADRQRQPITVANARANYEAAWKIFESLPQSVEEAAAWKEFVSAWKDWRSDNVEFFKMNTELDALGIPDPKALESDLFEVRGTLWKTLSSLAREFKDGVVLSETDTVNTLLADSAGDWTAKITTANLQIQKSIEVIRPMNAALLSSVRKVRATYAQGEKAAAKDLFEKETYPSAMKIIELMRPMRVEANKATALREKMAHQLMTVCHASETKALGLLAGLIESKKTIAANTAKASISQATTLKGLNLAVMVLGVAVALLLGIFITRGLVKIIAQTAESLSEGSDQVAAASSQISSASQSLAEGASEQAASLEETSSSLEEIASMTKHNAENALSAKDLSSETRQAAETGAANMQEMNRAMADIQSASSNIAKIIKTIDEIAFQTNILALNAAVEAARAGEAGAGFAVVADEVRNLAQRSANAAKETAEKIEDSIAKSANGVAISGKVTESLTQIVTKARQVDELVADIATASREQSQGIDQVNTAVTQMDKVTQSNAAAAEESASASEELTAQADTLRELVADLQKLVTGADNAGSSASRAQRQVAHTRPYRAPAAKSTTHRPALGGARPALESPKKKNPESEIPLEDGFKDF